MYRARNTCHKKKDIPTLTGGDICCAGAERRDSVRREGDPLVPSGRPSVVVHEHSPALVVDVHDGCLTCQTRT